MLLGITVQGRSDRGRSKQVQKNTEGQAVLGHRHCKKSKGKQGRYEKVSDAFFTKPGYEAPDAVASVILPVPVVKKNADGIDKKKSAGCKKGKSDLPVPVAHY